MAPIKIQHIVSFSSQDPKHPVENLLIDGPFHPWLCCPQDRSRQLKVELQLEKASHIRYIDIGNSGSAFLQIDVGRSSWPLDRAYITLLPTNTLMSPADSKLGKNRNGVKMFKEGDFLAEVSAEKWDRVRICCSQPFNKKDLFGLSFIRLRSPLDDEYQDRKTALHSPQNKDPQENGPPALETSCLSLQRMATKCAKIKTENQTEEEITKIPQPWLAPSPPTGNTVCLSRANRMVQAAKSRKRCYANASPGGFPVPSVLMEKGNTQEGETVLSPGSSSDITKTPPTPRQESRRPKGRRRLRMEGPTGRTQASLQGRPSQTRRGNGHPTLRTPSNSGQDCGKCPICAGYFHIDYLPIHASTCGEELSPQVVTLLFSSDDDDSDDTTLVPVVPPQIESLVTCPICELRFRSTEIEFHANTCGE
ncbi:hypothetical protein GDO86_004844 [Hymenochirus boettgeri]|uniref:DNA-repair protein Xrcc1 N-terminal domain-containing protein n=1 Tax=Hymenochirus boettgeri TaxID=247094 RepID=A0A8T2KC59_9PIPI|nr:hypothetical protein GDO86_004844 [Hymenochirus boettgeri]KAG8453180.1 hypothetical protein GDO86_004844 [Hymenochirus boettgeri]